MPITESDSETLQQIKRCCEALHRGKVDNLKVLDLDGHSTITDYFVIASAASEPHLRALRRAVEDAVKDQGIEVIGAETAAGTGWMVVDAFDFMIHLFLPEVRDKYRLESVWKDAIEIEVETGLSNNLSTVR